MQLPTIDIVSDQLYSLQLYSLICDPLCLVDVNRRQALILEMLTESGRDTSISQSPFATLVKRLQESLTRMESFEVVSVSPSGDGA